MNPKKKCIKFKREIGIVADEKMVTEEFVKASLHELHDWSMCCSKVWNFKSKNDADEGTAMMPPYSRERKHFSEYVLSL